MKAAVLFARSDSIYKSIPDLDVYDIERDARSYSGPFPVVAHPPCRAWGRLRGMAKPRPDEKELAIFAVDQVRKNGGVLEHPEFSSLWAAAGLPKPGQFDHFGGWTFPIAQYWFGHRAMKKTWLYIVGIMPADLPPYPLALGESPCVIAQNSQTRKIHKRPEVSRAEREHTPVQLAQWLVDLAVIAGGKYAAH